VLWVWSTRPSTWPNKKGPARESFSPLKLMRWMTRCPSHSLPKKQTTYRLKLLRIMPLWWSEKQDSCIFNLFWLKASRKNIWNLIQPIHSLQKLKKIAPKPIINLKSSSCVFFTCVFNVRKRLIITLLIIWNKINIKINRFRAWNHRQQRLSLFKLKSQDPVSLLH
jgi:hypothetical protein